jgi:sporulation protein YlmC with PRC-barrel domain
MKMLRSLNELNGYSVLADDGTIGKVAEFFFDDEKWGIRYLVVDTGKWLSGRKVLIAPIALRQPDWINREFPVALTMEKVRASPDIDTDNPVARQHEAILYRHYGWEAYWAGEAIIGNPDLVESAFSTIGSDTNKSGKPFNPHLRTTRIITGCHAHAIDGDIGHVVDFIVDDESWTICNLVVDTGNILSGKKVLVPPEWVDVIEWQERRIFFKVTKEEVKKH